MATYNSIKNDFLQINSEISSLFATAESIPGISGNSFNIWEKERHSIEKQMAEDIVRVAVVGPTKSGKSTFINAYLGGDYLRRGAGVVTSIVTRIRTVPTLKAILDFKTWDEVNDEMRQAMVLFPSLNPRFADGQFDIRRNQDRTDLKKALNSLSSDQLISNGTRDVNGILLSSYLKGYKRVKGILSSGNRIQQYEKRKFARHKDFVGDDSLAVYLRDMELHIEAGHGLDDNIEIADCQGSDSPNPLHLTMIQDYLLKTNFIIYVLSSRTGIRQADIKFLAIIKKMGFLENILFVINCDFSEHEGLDDFVALIKKVKEEISLIKRDPEIFAFSTLFNLFRQLEENLPQKDRLRLKQWKEESELVTFSNEETKRFETAFYEKLTGDRFTILLKNQLERLAIMASGIHDWISINHDILTRDSDSAHEVFEKICREQELMNQAKLIMKDAIDGASQKTKLELGKDINRFLHAHYGNVIKEIQKFIKNYNVAYQKHEDNIETSGFSSTMYAIFQEFKHALDIFIAETINPKIIKFIRQEEEKIEEFLNNIASTYDAMVKNAIQKYDELLLNLEITLKSQTSGVIQSIDLEGIKSKTVFNVQPLISSTEYTVKIHTEAIMRLGFYNLIKVIKKILKKPIQNEKEGEILALRDGVKRIKQETERSIIFYLKNYKENLKFQYIFKLVEEASNCLHETLIDRFYLFTTDISGMAALIGEEQSGKEKILDILESMEDPSRKILEEIDQIRGNL
jgi:GTPase SAR1 family protein